MKTAPPYGFLLPKYACAESSTESLVREFQTAGGLWLNQVFSDEFIDALAAAYQEKYLQQSSSQLSRQFARVGQQRWMITLDLEAPFSDPQLLAAPPLLNLLESLLGPDLRVASFGSVVTRPNATDQAIHFDHPPLFENEQVCAQLPSYAVTVVVPLIDTTPETGSTAMWPGSHVRVGAREELVGLMEHPDWSQSSICYPQRGDAYLMDYRLIHGGTANRSQRARPILYIVYSRPWFRDAYNFADQPAIRATSSMLDRLPDTCRRLFD